MPDSMNITIANLKINKAMSDETLCFSATVRLDGKKVGQAHNHGHGGGNDYSWDDAATGRMIEEWAEQQPLEYDFDKLDQIIDMLISAEEDRRWLRSHCRKHLLFRLSDDAEGAWRTMENPDSEGARAWVANKYGDKVAEFANDRC